MSATLFTGLSDKQLDSIDRDRHGREFDDATKVTPSAPAAETDDPPRSALEWMETFAGKPAAACSFCGEAKPDMRTATYASDGIRFERTHITCCDAQACLEKFDAIGSDEWADEAEREQEFEDAAAAAESSTRATVAEPTTTVGNLAADAEAAAQDVESLYEAWGIAEAQSIELESQRAQLKDDLIAQFLEEKRASSATAAEKLVTAEPVYAAHRRIQAENVIAVKRAEGRARAADHRARMAVGLAVASAHRGN